MFVVIQFPLVDGRVFTSAAGLVNRPDWSATRLSRVVAHRDFVRGFGRLAYRRAETNADWTDEAVFAYARRAVQLPSLQRRHFVGRNGGRWRVSCRFRRLFSDGAATLRLEIGFEVTVGPQHKVSAEEVVSTLLALPAVVPGESPGATQNLTPGGTLDPSLDAAPAETAGQTADATPRGTSDAAVGGSTMELALVGPSIARRYAAASTRHGCVVDAVLVSAGDPVVVVDDDFWATEPPADTIEAGNAVAGGRPLRLATTRTRYGGVETWYLPDAKRDAWRNPRLVILGQHAREESLDRLLRWAATGALTYRPRTDEGDRFEAYVNEEIRVVNGGTYRGVDCAAMRTALDVATSTRRNAVSVRRRERLDGMRRQVRERAERFLARREARRPTFNVSGRVVHAGEFSGQFYGPVAGTAYAEQLENSFNGFAAQAPDEQLRHLVAELHEQVADLVGRLKTTSPDAADEVAGTLASFTEEAGKEQPDKVTLRALGNGIVEVAKKVAEVTTPVAIAVAAVLKLF